MSRPAKDSFFPSTASTSQEDLENGASSTSSRKLRVTLLSSEWKSTKGGLSTINRELAIHLAKHPIVEVSVYLPQCGEDDKKVAADHNVHLIEAEEMPGLEPDLWLSSLPDGHAVDCVIGHGVHLGRQVQIIKRHHTCKWFQVVHTAPEELGMYKSYAHTISKGEKKHQVEVKLCELADQVVAIGPKLADTFSGYLRSCGKDQDVFNLTPGIFSEFADVKQATEEIGTFSVLVFGRGDSEDFQLKGYDIAAQAIAKLKDMTYKLVFVGAPSGEEENVKEMFLQQGIDRSQLRVRRFKDSREQLAELFCEVDLAVMPSRTEGFGLAALEALSAGLPVLVSGNSGLGEALKKVPYGVHVNCVVESEDPKEWAKAIAAVRQKDRKSRLEESKVLCREYAEMYSWREQCDKLVERMMNISQALVSLRIDCVGIAGSGPVEGATGTVVSSHESQEVVQGAEIVITDIESRLEAEKKEQLEKQEALSGAFGYIAKIDERVDFNEDEIYQFKERQSNLEITVWSSADEQASFTSEVGASKIGQTRLDSSLKALKAGSYNGTANTKIFQVPSRNRCFCGRDSELGAIAAQLKNTQGGCVHLAICGLGGVGKTSLAVEFLWRNEKEYPGGIFWISGENNNLFQRSLGEMARQIGMFEKDFYNSLSRTLDWLGKRKELWCLVVDNLDELQMSTEMRKLLTGHWKHTARGHIIITTRREVSEVGEETGVDEQSCIELKCLTEEEGIHFLRMRTGKNEGEDSDMRELVRELGGLPLAIDQAGAFLQGLNLTIKEYVKKYKEKKLLLLKKKKARHHVENTTSERLAVHTTWMLNFDHISRISEDMEIGEAPTLFMQVCAFLGPDDIPHELINEGLNKEGSSTVEIGLLDQAEIASLLTKFSLFQRYGTNSFSVHRLVQEVIQNQMEKEQTELNVLFCAVGVLHHALKNTRSPAEVCESFVEDAVFSVENPPSLQLWGKLALHATYLQEHLRTFSGKHQESAHTLLYTEETVRIFNEAGIFFSVSQEKVKAQEIQQLKLDFLVNLTTSRVDGTRLPNYFIDVPLKDRDCKLISHCMRQPATEGNSVDEADSSRTEREENANQLREQGNLAVKNKKFEEAAKLYSSAINLSAGDYRFFANRALCHLKLGQPQQALDDCEKSLTLKPYYSTVLQRKAWALQELVKSGASHLVGQKRAALALALHFGGPNLHQDKTFNEMFPEVGTHSTREISNGAQLAHALMTTQGNETLLLHEGEYNLAQFVTFMDLQIVGLGQDVVLNCKEHFEIAFSKCYFEKITFNFSKQYTGLSCQGKDVVIHMKHCKLSGGSSSCEDYPECNGGPGCIAASLGKPVCDRTGKFGDSKSKSGIGGIPGVQILNGSSALFENCAIHDCGGGGALVVGEGSHMEVRKCQVYKNHQAGLEAREGGQLVASENRIFNCGFHGILIGPNAGECDINGNKIFENAREAIYALSNKNTIKIRKNDVHHNRHFGLSLDDNSHLQISENNIFDNGFWGILAKSRTSASITGNVISGNKCGGIFIGINYSGLVHLESNIVRDHSGPWLEYRNIPRGGSKIELANLLTDVSVLQDLPPGEKQFYSNPPILGRNKEFNNKEGMHHPREVIERFYSGCTFCRRSGDEELRLTKCPTCHIASYCSKECQVKHWSTHKTLCIALKSRYSVTVKMFPLVKPGETPLRTFGTHLKGIGTGPKPKRKSRQEFIVKIQTQTLNSHPLQLLFLYDKSLTIDCNIQSPEIFGLIMECGVLGELKKFTSKKVFFWAVFAEKGEKLNIFLDHLAPYQEW